MKRSSASTTTNFRAWHGNDSLPGMLRSLFRKNPSEQACYEGFGLSFSCQARIFYLVLRYRGDIDIRIGGLFRNHHYIIQRAQHPDEIAGFGIIFSHDKVIGACG